MPFVINSSKLKHISGSNTQNVIFLLRLLLSFWQNSMILVVTFYSIDDNGLALRRFLAIAKTGVKALVEQSSYVAAWRAFYLGMKLVH